MPSPAQPRVLDVLFSTDRNFVFPAGALLVSMLENSPNLTYIFHICTRRADVDFVKTRLVGRIRELYPDCRHQFNYYAIEDFPSYSRLTAVLNQRQALVCTRLTMPDELQLSGDRLLFIDVDMICQHEPLAAAEVELGADMPLLFASPPERAVNTCGREVIDPYYNAGILLFNLPVWRSGRWADKCMELLGRYRPRLADQDVLNALIEDKAVLSTTFQCYTANYSEQSHFVHYAGGKPWDPWHYGEYKTSVRQFRRYAKIFEPDVTRWISFKPDKDSWINYSRYRERKATRWMAKKMRRRGAYKGFLHFYLKHYLVKYRQKGLLGTLLMRSSTRS